MSKRMLTAALAALALAGCGKPAATPPAASPDSQAAAPAPASDELQTRAAALFRPLPAEMTSERNPLTEAKVSLGRMLYFDTRLSRNQELSCNSCHDLARYGVDSEATSPGFKAQRGSRNSPTTYNAALHIAQFWDGRAADVEEQAKGPVLNPVEMAMPDGAAVVKVLKSIPGYASAFAAAFPGEADPITYDNAAAAIGAFERRLVTPSPFDRYLEGDSAALTAEQRTGLATFMDVGCTTCHNGVGIGGGMYQKLGLVKPFATSDLGREEVTKNEADKFMFKVPSLRNITETAPYFHDGKVVTLDEAIRLMGEHQLGRSLTDAQVGEIRAFLGSLKGEIPAQYVARPELPASGPETPKADKG
ncbi:MAG: cytochrome-c peroxidase [Gammaproteobacteria bacterium]|nr:cytochrome-c peroxidase [Gammaproteobacteria bacterium]QOJ32946.1 MAG: cytochrome-c peroxidase [Gammaproteobacteria bacterium]